MRRPVEFKALGNNRGSVAHEAARAEERVTEGRGGAAADDGVSDAKGGGGGGGGGGARGDIATFLFLGLGEGDLDSGEEHIFEK